MFANFFDTECLIHSVKTTIACLCGVFIAETIGGPGSLWVPITIVVVMCAQIYVGSVIQKAYLRFLGTLLGCIVATFALITFGHSQLTIVLTIGFASFIFSYLAASSANFIYPGTLGAVTTIIIMLGQKPNVYVALERFLEISLGILIATAISQVILPIHARTHLRRTQAKTLAQLRDYYLSYIVQYCDPLATSLKQDLEQDENIVISLSKQRQLAKEAAKERFGEFYQHEHFLKTLQSERNLLRAIHFMHHAILALTNRDHFSHSAELRNFNGAIVQAFNVLISTIEKNETSDHPFPTFSLQTLHDELKNNHGLTTAELVDIDGFLFIAKILTNNLIALAINYQTPIHYEAALTTK